MENNQPSFKSNLTHCKDEIDGFIVRNEVKEKISSFASASYEKVFSSGKSLLYLNYLDEGKMRRIQS